ncbi:phage tail tip lysozyme [Rhodobacter capsulatus]|uniref:phage tail tip lysozyme n=1 Tax=Rhodobacter capsulatus TaxID=1061 RepID=UPI00402567BB
MSTQTQLEIMLRVVADQARRELGQAKGDVQALTGAARDLGAQAGQGRDGLAVLGVGAAGVGKSLAEASVAALDTSAAMSNMMAAAGRGATSLAGVQNAVTGLTTNISAQVSDAWDSVRQAGESAIDGIFDALKEGDVGGAFENLASEIGSMFEELAITNPLKNAIFGTDYATMGDVGGLQGIWDRYTGKGTQVDPSQAAAAAMRTVASINVTAATVIIGGAGVGSLAGGIGAAGGMGGLQGSADVQKQVWSYFSGKGLKPHQIAGIMGNISQESAFNPLAVGDAGQAYGLFQHNDRKGALFGAIGGKQNLGNVQAQLDFAWKELMTSENGAYQRLMASKNVTEATGAFAGFERPRGWSAANPMGSDGWANRLGAAEQAMAKFGTTTTLATGQLGTMGTGFDKFGQALGSAVQGGGGGGFWGTLFSGIMSGLGIPGFAGGGNHAGGLRVVGENGRKRPLIALCLAA